VTSAPSFCSSIFSSTACWIFDCSYSLRTAAAAAFLVEDVAAHLRFDALELGFSGLELIFGVQRIALELGIAEFENDGIGFKRLRRDEE